MNTPMVVTSQNLYKPVALAGNNGITEKWDPEPRTSTGGTPGLIPGSPKYLGGTQGLELPKSNLGLKTPKYSSGTQDPKS